MARKLTELTKDELIAKIADLEDKLKKRYGLVWDREKEPEKIVVDCERNVPVLQADKTKAIINSGEDNILIEGDNYHALTCLNYTHRGKIDVIYIDPPYNRGGDFVYNDKRLSKDDEYKHSKWLNFMEKRLELAKHLLSPRGVLFISIDDFEYSNLKLLCDKIFQEEMVDTMVWRKSGEGRDGKMKNTTTFRKDHEYILCCFNKPLLNKLIEKPNFQNEYGNPDNDPRGNYKPGSISNKESASNPSHAYYYSVTAPGGKVFTRQFNFSKEEFDKYNNDILINADGKKVSRIYWGKNNNSVPAIKIFINEERSITPSSLFLNKGTTTEGTKEAESILQKDCHDMRPKPTNLLTALVQLASSEDSIVLDFFAGTGTTGQAVLAVNKKYGGQRKFILCTNNEGNICSDYCFPRIQKVMKGYKKWKTEESIPGLGGNLTYYKTALIPVERIDKVTDRQRVEITRKAGTMIGLKESTLQETELTEYYQIFTNHDKTRKTAIYFREDESKMNELIKKLADAPTALYVFSYSKVDKEAYKELGKNIRVEDIPEPLLQIYKEINLKIEDK